MAKQLTAKEIKALVEELTECFRTNLFKGDEPDNWAQAMLEWIETHPAKGWGWSLASIIDIELNGIEAWDSLEQRETVAKEIVRYLENQAKEENK
jgi:hypothetical protein